MQYNQEGRVQQDFVVVICDHEAQTIEDLEKYLSEHKPNLPLDIVQVAYDTWTGLFLKKHDGFFNREEADSVVVELSKDPAVYCDVVDWCHGTKEQSVK